MKKKYKENEIKEIEDEFGFRGANHIFTQMVKMVYIALEK